MAVLGWTLLRGWGEGIIWAVVGALCVDLFSAAPFGSSLLPFVLVSLLAGLAFGRRLGGYIVLPILLAFPLSLVFYLLSVPLYHLLGRTLDMGTGFQSIAVRAALLNMGVMLPVFPPLRWVDRVTSGETIHW